jgi:type IV pilus assembly protein PilX
MKRLSHLAVVRQRGVSLLFAMLALAAISLAAVALVRSVDSGSLVIGNLGFKQDTTRAADRAAEYARSYITGTANDLSANGAPGTGYYAQAQANLDPTGQRTSAGNLMDVVDWDAANTCPCTGSTCAACLAPSNEITLNAGTVRARYLITRLCPSAGPVTGANACAQPVNVDPSLTADRSGFSYGDPKPEIPAAQAPYYRIIVRTVGGRNTVSFTETIVH